MAHRQVFDATTERGASASYPQAIKICSGCPALTPRRNWVEGLKPCRRPLGVCGGKIHSARTKSDAA